jgi:hypothetical protein
MSLNDLFAQQAEELGLTTKPTRAVPEGPPPRLIVVGGNEDARARKWLARKVEETVRDLAALPPGRNGLSEGRNASLNAAAYGLGRYVPKWLSEAEVTEQLLYACRLNGLLDEDGEATCEGSISSGLEAGKLKPTDPGITPEDGTGGLAALGGISQEQTSAALQSAQDALLVGADLTIEEQEALEERNHAARVHYELVQLRARHDAKVAHQAELAARNFRAPAYTRTLTEELLIPDEPVRYAIEEILPVGGNALLAAQFKAGKTTLITNLLRAYADHEPFLGRFNVTPGDGRIAVFNYELSPSQYRGWLRESGIRNTDRVAVLHLRGYRLPITAPSVEDWVVNWLIEQECSAWIVDPFARAATGTDENSNTEVGVWLDTFDVIKQRAGISEAILPTHTGRAEQEQGQERARGATRLDDWADVRWLLSRNDEQQRFFRATGRDVELEEELLTYDPLTRSLTFGGGDRRTVKSRALEQAVLDYINANPGCGVKSIQNGVRGNKDQIDGARRALLVRHKARVEDGPKGAMNHYGNEETA